MALKDKTDAGANPAISTKGPVYWSFLLVSAYYNNGMGLTEFLFPRRCLVCGQLGSFICSDCRQNLQTAELVCPECGRLSVGGLTHPNCQTKRGLKGAIGIWQYCGLASTLVQELKYRFVKGLVKETIWLADRQLKNQATPLYLDFWQFMGKEPVIVPVPLHQARFNWRGFNQAAVIGRRLAQIWQLPLGAELLQRVKATQPQVKLKGKARQENVKGAFQLAQKLASTEKPLNNKSFLLIDDVWTTGSTMRECGKVLKRAGAAQVWGLTLAR